MKKYSKNFICLNLLLLLAFAKPCIAQEAIGMATGNYAGVSGIWFNPASIADSRYKFDINIIGINSYFNNNYLTVKNTAFVRRLFYKEPYNSSFDAVKRDLLQEQLPVNGKVFGRVESNIHFPLSFMVTTGKRSAIAFTMNNRTVNKIDNMPVELAQAFYHELRDPSLYDKNIRADSLQQNFLNWQEIGFTYSRVMVQTDHHFLKLGFTLKWLGANSGGYIQTDNAVVNFKDSQTLSLNSPLIHYARTEMADIGKFKRRDLFNNLEDQAFGWDAGLVYEFRARVKKFEFINENLEEAKRRDLNKYMFRIGLSVVDMGKFTLNKQPLTNDHSANIVNWDFSGVKASSFSGWDSAYSKQVNNISGAPGTFTYRLPAALIANFDLHLFGGFYINLAAKAPFESFKKATDTYITPNKWIAVTPRFEGKFLGIYVPVIRSNNKTNIGATVKFGPVYAGSNNLSALLSNSSSYEADFHAGLRLSIPYGKPNAATSTLQKYLRGQADTSKYKSASQQQLEDLQHQVDQLQKNLYDSVGRRNVQIFINNDGVTSTVNRSRGDSVVIQNRTADQQRQNQERVYQQKDGLSDSLAQQLAIKTVELDRLQKSADNSKGRKGKKNSKETYTVENNNDDIAKELSRIRKQMAIQNAAIIGGGTVAAVAVSENNKDKKAANAGDSLKGKDSASSAQSMDSSGKAGPQKTDTLIIRDTVRIAKGSNDVYLKAADGAIFEPIYFASGISTISLADKKRLQALAIEVNKHKEWQVVITGMTDATGSVEANRKIASKRCAAVANLLLQNGVNDHKIILRTSLADNAGGVVGGGNPRRVQLQLLSQ